MSASIEWGHTSNLSTYILDHGEEAGDHQSVADDSDNPEEIGLMFDAGGNGYCLVGTPKKLHEALIAASNKVAEYLLAGAKSEEAASDGEG